MEIKTVWEACFSATGGTQKVVARIAERLAKQAGASVEIYDFTLPQMREQGGKVFGAGDLVVFGTPVYAGRVPNLLIKFVASVRGQGALAVPVVTYGNRSYDDGLMELCLTLEAGGFRTVAAGGFIAQHSFSLTQAAGRPDASDLTIASGFADQVWKKLERGEDGGPISAKVRGNNPVGPYYTPRDRQGNPINILKVTPKTSEACRKCGKCARLCPLGSINPENPAEMIGRCMKCNRCIKICPQNAKYFDDPNYLCHKKDLEEKFSWPRKEPEFFL